jgi:hypothetical protein
MTTSMRRLTRNRHSAPIDPPKPWHAFESLC